MRPIVVYGVALSLAVVACSSGSGRTGAAVVQDSAGITLVDHSAAGFAAAPNWALGANPVAVIGGEADDGAVDLSNSQLGTMLADGRVLAMSMQPPQLYIFNADGTLQGTLGRGGEGPGEYRFLSALMVLGADSIAGYDLMNRRALIFDAGGTAHDPIQFPLSASPIPPLLSGRLTDGTWFFQSFNPMAEPPAGTTGVYRNDAPVLTWRTGSDHYDTVFTTLGPMLKQGTVSMGGNSMTIGRGIGYGSNSFLGGSGDLIWSTTGERFVISGHDATGALKRQIRVALPARAVTEADRERFKGVLREALERVRSMAPPALIESELAKVDETPFAEQHAGIGQMLVDRLGRIWATPNLPQVDSVATWAVFAPDGALLGKVTVPAGTLYAASEDRIVVRREDPETGLVRLEVLAVQRDQ